MIALSPVPELPAAEFTPPLRLRSPFLIRGAAPWARELTPNHLASRYGDSELVVRSKSGNGDMFTASNDGNKGICSLREYIDFLQEPTEPSERLESYYVEEQLERVLPGFLGTVPSWCAGAILNSLHVAAKGVSSGLHIDRYDGHFVQAAGRKRWILFPPDHGPILEQVNWHCRANPDAPDLEKFPRLAEARGFSAILEPGDVMYFPAGWFHKVGNCTDIGISMTFFFPPEFAGEKPTSLLVAEETDGASEMPSRVTALYR